MIFKILIANVRGVIGVFLCNGQCKIRKRAKRPQLKLAKNTKYSLHDLGNDLCVLITSHGLESLHED